MRCAVSASAKARMPVSTVITRRTPSAYAASSTARLQAVAFAEPVRNMKANRAAEHLDRRLQQHNGSSSVDVVVAVQQDRLFARDGCFDAFYRGDHAHHQQGIVKLRNFRIKKCEGFARSRDAARDQQFRQNHRNTRRFCQCFSFLGMRLVQNPTLARNP